MRQNHYAPGDWNAVCSLCGRKRKASDLVRNWQGMYRCREHNEERHPQDFVKGVIDNVSVPWAQPPVDIDLPVCTFNGRSGYPGMAEPGCSIPGNIAADFSNGG